MRWRLPSEEGIALALSHDVEGDAGVVGSSRTRRQQHPVRPEICDLGYADSVVQVDRAPSSQRLHVLHQVVRERIVVIDNNDGLLHSCFHAGTRARKMRGGGAIAVVQRGKTGGDGQSGLREGLR